MKRRLKIIPSVLLLVLCLGILGVGIYAAKPASNTITGTVNVVAAAPEVQIDVYKSSVAEGNRIAPVFDRRTSGTITFNANSLEFVRTAEAVEADGVGATNSLAEANLISEVAPITVIFRVTNKSSKDVGVYFSRTPMAAQLTGLTANNITTSTTFNSDDYVYDDVNEEVTAGYGDVVNATFTGYRKAAKNNGTLDLTMTLTLSQLYEEDITVDISDLYINIELFQSEYDSYFTEGLTYTLQSGGTYDGTYFVTGPGTATDTEIVIPATYNGIAVTGIGDVAFSEIDHSERYDYVRSITSIKFGNNVRYIGSNPFIGCNISNMSNFGSLQYISADAFSNNRGHLSSFWVSSSATLVNDNYGFGGSLHGLDSDCIIYTDVSDASTANSLWGTGWNIYGYPGQDLTVVYNTSYADYLLAIA